MDSQRLRDLFGTGAATYNEGAASLGGWARLNLGRALEHAIRRFRENPASGDVPGRVAWAFVAAAASCEDELAAEYLGGILVASRSADPRDDRGVPLLLTVPRLSSYQLRAHALLYASVKRFFDGSGFSLARNDRPRLELYIPFTALRAATGLPDEDPARAAGLLESTLFGLFREGLIEGPFLYGARAELRRVFPEAEEAGLLLAPSVPGAQLYLFAHGLGGASVDRLLDPATALSGLPVDVPEGIAPTRVSR